MRFDGDLAFLLPVDIKNWLFSIKFERSLFGDGKFNNTLKTYAVYFYDFFYKKKSSAALFFLV